LSHHALIANRHLNMFSIGTHIFLVVSMLCGVFDLTILYNSQRVILSGDIRPYNSVFSNGNVKYNRTCHIMLVGNTWATVLCLYAEGPY